MIRVEVLEDFTLGRFNELKNIQRKSKEEKGRLFTGDIFECEVDLADYLTKNNSLGRAFVRVIEIIPEKEIQKGIDEEVKKEVKVEKLKRTRTSKKTIAKKD